MDFLNEQIVLFTSERFEPIYIYFNKNFNIKYHELFNICMSIGFKNNRKSTFENRGREFRSNYLKSNQRISLYSMILADPDLGRSIEKFEDKTFQLKARKIMENYAEGGMEILVEEVFESRWDNNNLDPTYKEYDVDLLSYVYQDSQSTPF